MSIPPRAPARYTTLVVAAAVLWHLLAVLAPPPKAPPPNTAGRDYASYHYAAQAARAGSDPYDKAVLGALAAEDGTRDRVHPYLYPPVFLLLATPTSWLPLQAGFDVWFVLNELCLLAAVLVLVRWLRPWAPDTGAVLAVLVALTYGVAYGAELGQANLIVLLLVIVAAWQVREHPGLAGAVLGVACMLKMSPALMVLWFAAERRWRAVGAAVLAALGASVLSLLVAGPEVQLRFYTEVLPGLLSGQYNGLVIKLGMFGNHSLPNLMHQLFPSGSEHALSASARAAGAVLLLPWLGFVGWSLQRSTGEAPPAEHAGRFGVVLVTMLLVPAFTYEHHLVLALPAMAIAVLAILQERLSGAWAVPVGLSIAVLAYPLPHLKTLAAWLSDEGGPMYWLVQELPFAALLVLLAAMARLGLPRLERTEG